MHLRNQERPLISHQCGPSRVTSKDWALSPGVSLFLWVGLQGLEGRKKKERKRWGHLLVVLCGQQRMQDKNKITEAKSMQREYLAWDLWLAPFICFYQLSFSLFGISEKGIISLTSHAMNTQTLKPGWAHASHSQQCKLGWLLNLSEPDFPNPWKGSDSTSRAQWLLAIINATQKILLSPKFYGIRIGSKKTWRKGCQLPRRDFFSFSVQRHFAGGKQTGWEEVGEERGGRA